MTEVTVYSMMFIAFLVLISGVETKESPVKCEYSDEKKVSECLQVRLRSHG